MENKKILIVEDEKPMARAIECKLKQNNFTIKIASNGEEALTILGGEIFDLIILDLIMPEMDGFTLLASLAEKGINIPVIVLTNLSQEEDIKRTKDYKVVDYCVKSEISLIDLVKKIKLFFIEK
ncbi:MAG TPA: response regulator [Patescibacteria group bacterium]|nr:response regulator [Patescibacteria group bacterium]